MLIELSKVKINKAFSRETVCFTATILENGNPVAYVENDGNGGANHIQPLKAGIESKIAFSEAMVRIEAYTQTLPSIFGDWDTEKKYPIPQTLDVIVDTLIGDEMEKADLRRLLKSNVVFRNEKGLFKRKVPKGADIKRFIDGVRVTCSGAIILNCLAEKEALEVYRKAA